MGGSMSWCRVTPDELAGGLPPISAISGEPASTVFAVTARDPRVRGSSTRVELPITSSEVPLMGRQTTLTGVMAVSLVAAIGILMGELRHLFTLPWIVPGALGAAAVVAGAVAATTPHCGARLLNGRLELYVCAAFRDALEARRLDPAAAPRPAPLLGATAPGALPPSFADATISANRERRRRWIPLAVTALVVAGVGVYWLLSPDTATPDEAERGMCLHLPKDSAEEFELADCDGDHEGEVAGISHTDASVIAAAVNRVGDPNAEEPDRCGTIVADYLGGTSRGGLRVIAYGVTKSTFTGAPYTSPDVICVVASANGSPLTSRVGR